MGFNLGFKGLKVHQASWVRAV